MRSHITNYDPKDGFIEEPEWPERTGLDVTPPEFPQRDSRLATEVDE